MSEIREMLQSLDDNEILTIRDDSDNLMMTIAKIAQADLERLSQEDAIKYFLQLKKNIDTRDIDTNYAALCTILKAMSIPFFRPREVESSLTKTLIQKMLKENWVTATPNEDQPFTEHFTESFIYAYDLSSIQNNFPYFPNATYQEKCVIFLTMFLEIIVNTIIYYDWDEDEEQWTIESTEDLLEITI